MRYSPLFASALLGLLVVFTGLSKGVAAQSLAVINVDDVFNLPVAISTEVVSRTIQFGDYDGRWTSRCSRLGLQVD